MFSLDLSQIRTPESRVERVWEAGQFEAEADFRVAGQVSLAFEIFKSRPSHQKVTGGAGDRRVSGDLFRLEGRLQSVLELPCSRCLEPYATPVDARFDLTYVPHADNAGEGEHELGQNELTTAYYENDTLDLGQLMREQFYLSLPMKPLCRDECRGLCPVCGTNLNRDACGCTRAWEDPRLAVLKTLKKDS